MRFQTSVAEQGYVKGLMNAEAKGFAAASDPAFTERDNPYQRFEHRKSWMEGFRRGRAALREKEGGQ